MAAKVWDRDEYLRMNRERRRQQEAERVQRLWPAPKPYVEKTGFWATVRGFWNALTPMFMYSSDPQLARVAMIDQTRKAIRAHEQLAEDRMVAQAQLTAQLTAQAIVEAARQERLYGR